MKDFKYKVLEQNSFARVEHLRKLIKEDKLAARVYAMNRDISVSRVVLLEESKHKFIIISEVLKYGVSRNYRIYFRTKKTRKLFVNNGKFTLSIDGTVKGLRPLKYHMLRNCEREILYEKYPWMRFYEENYLSFPFNISKTHRAYSPSKVLSAVYGLNKLASERIHDLFSSISVNTGEMPKTLKIWRKLKENISNIENINEDHFSSRDNFNILIDSSKMAESLNVKINGAWSVKRIKLEHDRMSRRITSLLLKGDQRELQISAIFKEFDKFIGGGYLITNTMRLLAEGITQSHCVATYSDKIEKGECAIYHILGYTAEIRIRSFSKGLYINQFKGYRNENAPDEVQNLLISFINEFNESIGIAWYTNKVKLEPFEQLEEDIPF